MKTHAIPALPDGSASYRLPDADELAALRVWHAGLPARRAVERYLSGRLGAGESARGLVGRIRRQLVRAALRISPPFAAAHRWGEATVSRS